MPLGSRRVVIGIDPGKHGAIAVLSSDGNGLFFDTPLRKVEVQGKRDKKGKKKTKEVYDEDAMLALIRRLPRGLVVLETQQAMPPSLRDRRQGTVSSFATGEGFGLWRGLLRGQGRRYKLVHPLQWKKAMMSGYSKEKAASADVAAALFPLLADQFVTPRLRVIDGRSDACLLAAYGFGLHRWRSPARQALRKTNRR